MIKWNSIQRVPADFFTKLSEMKLLVHMAITVAMLILVSVLIVFLFKWSSQRSEKRSEPHQAKQREFRYRVLVWSWTGVIFFSILLLLLKITTKENYNTNVTAVVDAALRSSQAFTTNFSLKDVLRAISEKRIMFNYFDRAWIAILMASAPLITVGNVVTLFRGPRLWFLLHFSRKRDICIFSCANDRALRYASALRAQDDSTVIVFCSDEKTKNGDVDDTYIVVKKSITALHMPTLPSLANISFYLIMDDENSLLEVADKLQRKYRSKNCHIYFVSSGKVNEHAIDRMNKEAVEANKPEQKDRDRKRSPNTQNTAQPQEAAQGQQTVPGQEEDRANEAAKADQEDEKEKTIMVDQDGVLSGVRSRRENKRIRKSYVEIINEPSRVVYYDLYQQPIIHTEMLKRIWGDLRKTGKLRVLVLGAGMLGEELARNMLWYCQMPDTGVEVTIASQENASEIESKVFRRNLRYAELLNAIGYGERAELKVIGNKNLMTADLENILEYHSPYHVIFLATGDDSQNYQLALRVRRYYLRQPPEWGYPEIHAVIWNDTLTELIGKGGFVQIDGTMEKMNYQLFKGKSIKEQDLTQRCQVSLMGSMIKTIGMDQKMEFDALRYHSFYCGTEQNQILSDDKIEISVDTYTGYYEASESDERSNWAVAVHGKVKYAWCQAYCEQEGMDLVENVAAWCQNERNHVLLNAPEKQKKKSVKQAEEEVPRKSKRIYFGWIKRLWNKVCGFLMKFGWFRRPVNWVSGKVRRPWKWVSGIIDKIRDQLTDPEEIAKAQSDKPADKPAEKPTVKQPKKPLDKAYAAALHGDNAYVNALLAENEHIRWCVYKVLEGDSPLVDRQYRLIQGALRDQYLGETGNGRDKDTIRGYHLLLRNWNDFLDLSYDEYKKDHVGTSSFWWDKIHMNVRLSQFSLRLVGVQKAKAEAEAETEVKAETEAKAEAEAKSSEEKADNPPDQDQQASA